MKPGDQRLIPVQIIGVYPFPEVSASPDAFLALLKGEDEKVVPITIGEFEGKALSMARQRLNFSRPLTHNLIHNLLEKVKGRVQQVVIHTLKKETFYAYLFIQIEQECFYLDCRPSDGMILATLMGVPIFMSQEVLEAELRAEHLIVLEPGLWCYRERFVGYIVDLEALEFREETAALHMLGKSTKLRQAMAWLSAHPDPDAEWDRRNCRIYRIAAVGTKPAKAQFRCCSC